MKKLFLTVMFILCITNISHAQKYLESVNYMEASSRETSSAVDVMTTPVIADLDILPRIEETVTEPFKNINVTSDINLAIPTYKKIALAEVANKYNADLILGALVKVETLESEKGGRLAITISGYPAKYIKFRNATKEDIDLVRSASTLRTEEESVMDVPENRTTVVKEKVLQLL